jgi:hypothetical protein
MAKSKKIRGVILSTDEARELWAGDQIDVRRAATKRPIGSVGERLFVKEAHADEHPIAVQSGRYSQPGTAGIPGPPGVTYQTIYRTDGEPLKTYHKPQEWPFRATEPSEMHTRPDNFGPGGKYYWTNPNETDEKHARQFAEVIAVRTDDGEVVTTLRRITREQAHG